MKTTLYWANMIVSGWLCVAPLWLGSIPFLTDFGGRLEMAQAWNALGSDSFFDVFYQRRETWLAPNLLAARFAALMHPAVDALTALRLFVSVSLLGLMAALWVCLREFARSEWLLFPCIPFFWGGALTLGLINFVASFPLMFLALALGKRCVQRDGWADRRMAHGGFACGLFCARDGMPACCRLRRRHCRHVCTGQSVLEESFGNSVGSRHRWASGCSGA